MSNTNDAQLRSLIQLIPPARALKEELEKNLQLELYNGTGDFAVQSFIGLQSSVAEIVHDVYVANLAFSVPADADDQQKVSLASLAAGQLVAYLEGQTGLVGMGGDIDTKYNSPNVSINNIKGLSNDTIDRMLDVAGASKKAEGQDEE